MNSLHLIDGLHLGRPQVICTAALASADEIALFDCGPESVFDETVRALRRLGLDPQRVTRVFVSHIHFDHAGAAWRWAEEFGAIIGVHPIGAPHLADPSRLLASATKIFGDQMERLWGRMRAVPADKLHIIQDGAEFMVGRARVQALATPGHAPHHHAYWLPELGTVYAGDVAGVVIAGGPCLPPCPPPDIDLAAWKKSLERLRALAPSELILTHFGAVRDVSARLDELEQRLERWAEWMRAHLRAGREPGELAAEFERYVGDELRAAGLSAEEVATYEQADPAAMSIAGLARYWRKLRPEALL